MFFPFKDDSINTKFPFKTLLIIIFTTVIFVYQNYGDIGFDRSVYEFGLIPIEIINGENLTNSDLINPYLSIISSIFIHGNFFHFALNMLYLWIFGSNVESRMKMFYFYYLIVGIISVIAFVIKSPFFSYPLVGASGAISGILGAYVIMFPFARIHVWIFFYVIKMPAIIFVGFWFLLQVFGLLEENIESHGIAWISHISGFIAGILLLRFFINDN